MMTVIYRRPPHASSARRPIGVPIADEADGPITDPAPAAWASLRVAGVAVPMAGNVEEVLIRLNLGEDVNQKCYPR